MARAANDMATGTTALGCLTIEKRMPQPPERDASRASQALIAQRKVLCTAEPFPAGMRLALPVALRCSACTHQLPHHRVVLLRSTQPAPRPRVRGRTCACARPRAVPRHGVPRCTTTPDQLYHVHGIGLQVTCTPIPCTSSPRLLTSML